MWNRFLPAERQLHVARDGPTQVVSSALVGRRALHVNSSALTLTSPPTGPQTFNDLYFTWNQVPLAASYYLDVRDSSNRGVINTNTTATAYAPSTIGDGSLHVAGDRVDPNGGAIATVPGAPSLIVATSRS